MGIEAQFRDISNSKDKNERLIIYHNVYSAIKRVIKAPKSEKEALETQLRQMIGE